VQTLVACVDAHGPQESSDPIATHLQRIANQLLPELLQAYSATMSSEDRACLQLIRCLDELLTRVKGQSFLDVTGYLWGPLLKGILDNPAGSSVTISELLSSPGFIDPR
jgi:hypothetical protein